MPTYYTPWVDGSSDFKASEMNAPLEELDTQIVANVASITALQASGNQAGMSGNAGKFAMVNSAGTGLEFLDILTHDDDIVIHNGSVVMN